LGRLPTASCGQVSVLGLTGLCEHGPLLPLALIATVVTSTTALIAFLPWALERRRRPEGRLLWQFATDAPGDGLADWPPELVPDLSRGSAILVRVAMLNVGDQPASDALTNFVVPTCIALRKVTEPTHRPTASTDPIAGLLPDDRVTYFGWTGRVAPGDWLSLDYLLKSAPRLEGRRLPIRVRLRFSVSENRFNATGRRWLPALLRPDKPDRSSANARAGTRWPPRRMRRRFRLVRAEPRQRVLCTAGERTDTRELMLVRKPAR
jgi:hypothetical protein